MFRASFKNQLNCYKLLPMVPSQPEKPADQPHLLVVDDDKGIRDLLSRYLTEQGFRVSAVTDDDGASASEAELITVTEPVPNNPPVAIVIASTTSGDAPLSVDFDGSHSYGLDGSGIITSYDWNFGDGNTATGIYPTHVFMSAGSYTATQNIDPGPYTYTDTINTNGGGSWTYKVCEAGTANCSDPVTVIF